MQSFLLAILNAGRTPIISAIHTLLDVLYANVKEIAEKTDNDLDNSVLSIVVEAVHSWEVKNQ